MVHEFGKRQPRRIEPDRPGDQRRTPPLAESSRPPAFATEPVLFLAAQLAAAALLGFGLILWIAAHWDHIGRPGRFTLVGGALALAIAASFVQKIRVPALLAAFLASGGLFALIGQTYQTGADPWQLFATWAALTLPWALAARHDALWFGWCLVAIAASELWLGAASPMFAVSRDPAVMLAGWAVPLTIAALLSPWSPVTAWTGPTRWSFRITLLLAMVMIVLSGLASLTDKSGSSGLYILAVALLGAIAFALIALESFDLILIAAAGLALDVLLIAGIGFNSFGRGAGFTFDLLLFGVLAAAIVAGSGALILSLARDRIDTTFGGRLNATSTWPVILMTGIGVLIAAIPLLVVLGLTVGWFLILGPGPLVLGAAALFIAATTMRTTAPTAFLHQLSVVGLIVGLGLLAFGFFRDTGSVMGGSAMLVVVTAGMALAVGRTWVTGLLGAIAAVFAAMFLGGLFAQGSGWALSLLPFTWSLLIAAGSGWIAWRSTVRFDDLPIAHRSNPLIDLDRFMSGATAVSLLGAIVSAGPTLLISAALSGSARTRHLGGQIVFDATTLSVLSILLASAGCGWLLLSRPRLQTALGAGAAFVAIALSGAIPSLGALVLLLIVAAMHGKRALAIGAFAAAVWVIGAFYYALSWPLSDKAALMAACGLVLAMLCALSDIRRPARRAASTASAPTAIATGLIGAGAFAVFALAGQSIAAMESIIRTGHTIYVALAPVDPRSMMQGDYMALNWELPQRLAPRGATRLWAKATIDPRHVASIRALSPEPPPAGPDEIVIALTAKKGRWIVGTDAWFFKEGTAKVWQAARFGEFRVAPDGTAMLVNLVDQNLQPIR